MDGRIQFDMLRYLLKEQEGLKTYKLKYVATYFLGDTKEEVHYKEIPKLFNGN